jgi:predicted AlkP superfamily pyrophosphatase or phosphodiesterase
MIRPNYYTRHAHFIKTPIFPKKSVCTMKRIIFLPMALLVACCGWAQKTKYVVLVTIDGFRPDFYLDASWGTPNMRMMKDSGVCARGVNSIFPSVTYPGHTTIITGVPPAKHGIYYNAPFETNGPGGQWYFHYDSIKVPTLFDAVRKAGKTSANIIWPVSVGAPIDYNVPDVWSPKVKLDRREITAAHTNPAGLWKELQEQATGILGAADFAMDKEEMIMDENIGRMAAYILRTYKPTFTTLHLACTDHYEHVQGRDGFLVRKAVAGADRALGSIFEALERAGIKDSTAIIVTGDHGFVDIHKTFSPNVLLAQQGMINDAKNGNWKAQFYASGGSAFLHLKNKEDVQTVNQVRQLLNSLPQEQRKLFKIIERKQLDEIGADPHAALAIAAMQDVTISGAVTGAAVKPAKGGAHGYFPDFKEIQTGFVAYGPGFLKGTIINEMNLADIAPLIARLLKLDFSPSKVPPGILQKN